MINELRNKYVHGLISKEKLFDLYKKTYSNNNIKTFENMIGLLKQYEIITNYSNEYYKSWKKRYIELKNKKN